ncbi:MAG: hypothetical protein IJI54_15475, partial [Kiritimatiellae bacterium]|nr:hypothetical protein [Kiritimatiellia bacterium]
YASCGAITISGGTVNVTADTGAKQIGNGRDGYGKASSVTITGGAVYPALAQVSPAPTNTASKAVFPVDFEIGEATNKVTSLTLSGALSGYSYGVNDAYTDANGNLRVWLPATDGAAFVARVEMASGNTYYFSFDIDGNGKVTVRGYLVVNDEVVASNVDNSGTGWSFAKDTGVVTVSADAVVQGFSTNGEYRIVVPSASSASSVTFRNLTLVGPVKQNASTIDFERDVALVLSGSNTVATAGKYSAGIEVASSATLTIRAADATSASLPSLTATGGQNAAGIGSAGGFTAPGKIVIESGTIVAQGGEKAAGIGGGVSSVPVADGIVISGGHVTATGGANAAGIGSGYATAALPAGAVRITGGTVLATKGSKPLGNFGDLIMSGNANSVSGDGSDKSFVITGGSVHGTNIDAKPNPVDADGTPLRYLLVTNLSVGAEAKIVSADIPATYGMNDVVADSTGSVCLWLPQTNMVRVVSVNGLYFSVGGTTNNVFDAASGSVDPGDSRKEGSKTAWRVTLQQLTPGATVSISGLEPHASTATVDASGEAFVYLPDGDYSFTVEGKPWVAAVSGEPTRAHRVTGVCVNGEEAGVLQGAGWIYNATNGVLSLSGAGPYVLDGTNTEGTVRVRVETDASVTLSNLCLKAKANRRTPFAVASNVTARVWFTGINTLESGKYCAAIEVPGPSDLEIGGDGWLHAKGGACDDDWGCAAIGISDGMVYGFGHGITVTGGNIVALSGAIGTVGGINDPVVSGGSIFTGRYPLGDRYVLSMVGARTPQGENATCTIVPDLEPNAPVVLTGLPDYYNTSNIVADAEGKVYLYLKATYDDEKTYFTANGQLYQAVIIDSGGAITAKKVTYVPPDALHIDSIAVATDAVTFVVSAEPDGWLTEATAPFIRVRAAAGLPLPEGDEALLNQEDVKISLNGDGTATMTIPRAATAPQTFYRVEAPR